MNIAVTGASGNLGSVLVGSSGEHENIFFSVPSALYRPEFSYSELLQFFKENSISALVHCASLTNIDYAEINQEEAYESNVSLTKKFLDLAIALDLKFIFISSTGVYGTDSYTDGLLNQESLEPIPINCYHKTKLEAENIIISKLPGSLILRVGWLFGSISPSGKDFVKSRIEEMLTLSRNDTYCANSGQFGNPTSSQFVKECICMLLEKDVRGVFNCVNNGAVSRFQFIKKIKEICELDFILSPKPSSSFKRSAKVPGNETGCTLKLQNYIDSSHWEPYLVNHCTSFLNKQGELK